MKNYVIAVALLCCFCSCYRAPVFYELPSDGQVALTKVGLAADHVSLVSAGPIMTSIGEPMGGYIQNGILVKPWQDPNDNHGLVSNQTQAFAKNNVIMGRLKSGAYFTVAYADRDAPTSPIHPDKRAEVVWAMQNGPALLVNNAFLADDNDALPAQSSLLAYGSKNGKPIFSYIYCPDWVSDTWQLVSSLKEKGFTNAVFLQRNGGGYVYDGESNETVIPQGTYTLVVYK